jgi:S-adenosylmethionine:tRNA ribosyltransferase-isomerase
MKAARTPRADNIRLLIIHSKTMQDGVMTALPEHLQAGDLLVVNDAATLPASLHGHDVRQQPIEVRLLTPLRERVWQAVLFGAGDWHTPTEARPLPPALQAGEDIFFAEDFRARLFPGQALSPRLIELEFNDTNESLWSRLYRYGKPVQYSYLQHELALWSVQNVYSSRPWAVEMPSAGHGLTWQLLLRLLKKGVQIATLTHGAGLSATGDEAIDRALPLAERYEIPAATMAAVQRTKRNGRRVIAVGTSVVRALESAGETLSGWTTLRIGPEHSLQWVDGLLTGTHDVTESHYQLLSAFLPRAVLERMTSHLEQAAYLTHEFGDACLLWRERTG